MLTLKTEKRDIKADLAKLRKSGVLPAVFYGKKEKSTPIAVPYAQFLKVWREGGESSVITLQTPEGDLESLIYEVDTDPVTDIPRHADFYVFEKGKKIEVSVPIEFIGTSPAVKDLGAILIKALHELKISAFPKDLPHNIKVDIASLITLESHITAKDIKLPAGVDLMEKPDEIVASVAEAKDEPEEPAAPVDLSAIEVEKKGKKEEEGAEGGDAAAKAPAKDEKKADKADKK